MLIKDIFKRGISFFTDAKRNTEGFKNEAEELTKEIDQLKEDIETTENKSFISNVLDMASMTLIAIFSGDYKALCVGLKLLSDCMKGAEKPY